MRINTRAERWNRLAVALTFAGIGVVHFIAPSSFLRIMPPWVPYPATAVLLSGAAEIVLGIGLLSPRTRLICGIGLMILVVAVFPANVQMTLDWHQAHHPHEWVAWARLPLQAVILWWVWTAWRSRRRKASR